MIVPVKDRRALLMDTLDGLDVQTYTDFELVVVDDGSSDGSGEAAAARTVAGRPVRVVAGEGRGAVQARIAGVAASRGEILAFTDSDCVPAPKWLELAVAAVDAGAEVVNGRTAPARDLLPFERSMGSGEEGLYPTCNMLYRRDAYERVGGFDAAVGDRWGFRPDRRSKGDGFGEDTLLAWRVIRSGGPAAYVPDAVVQHAVFPPDHTEFVSRQLRVAAFPAMVRDIPELRGTALIRWGFQLGHRTRLPVYALVVALLLNRRLPAAVAFLWWTALRTGELRRYPIPWARRLKLLPVEMAVDALTAGALVAGSARARNVTL